MNKQPSPKKNINTSIILLHILISITIYPITILFNLQNKNETIYYKYLVAIA